DSGVEARRHPGVVSRVGGGPELRDLDGDLREEVVESLVSPDRARRPPLDRAGVARSHTLQRGIQKLLGGIGRSHRRRIQRRARMPGTDGQQSHGVGEGRGVGWGKGEAANSGIDGRPVGIAAYALGAKGLRPFFMTIVPAAVKSPILTKSRREICPVDHAFRISRRFLWAFSASLCRALDALPERYIRVSPCRTRPVPDTAEREHSLHPDATVYLGASV